MYELCWWRIGQNRKVSVVTRLPAGQPRCLGLIPGRARDKLLSSGSSSLGTTQFLIQWVQAQFPGCWSDRKVNVTIYLTSMAWSRTFLFLFYCCTTGKVITMLLSKEVRNFYAHISLLLAISGFKWSKTLKRRYTTSNKVWLVSY